jgi:hypothetical protein
MMLIPQVPGESTKRGGNVPLAGDQMTDDIDQIVNVDHAVASPTPGSAAGETGGTRLQVCGHHGSRKRRRPKLGHGGSFLASARRDQLMPRHPATTFPITALAGGRHGSRL